MKEPKQLSVSAIQNGTVIDHVPAKNLFKVIQILGLDILIIRLLSEPILKAKNSEEKQSSKYQANFLRIKILTGLH